jgi:hypothetical protein
MDSIRIRLRPAVVAAVLIAAAAGGSAAVFAATPSDPILARLHALEAPCNTAVGLVDVAASKVPRVEAGASADLDLAKKSIDAARRANDRCPGTLTGREQQLLAQGALVDKTYWERLTEIRFANDAILRSLDVQRNLILGAAGKPHGATSFARLDASLQHCIERRDLQGRLHDLCARQLTYNKNTEHGNATPDPSNPCFAATNLANAAGASLQADPESAFEKAHQGLEQNKHCYTAPAYARSINQAYLMSWIAAADLALNIQLGGDPDLRDPGGRSPFAVANRTLRECAAHSGDYRVLDATVVADCGKQLVFNGGFEKKYQDVENQPPCQGRTDCVDLPQTTFDSAAFQVRPEPQFLAQKANNESNPFAVEFVRGATGWKQVESQSVRSGSQPWILFAAVRTWPEFITIFDPATTPSTVKADYFKTKMLIVAVQRSPRQSCAFDPANPSKVFSVPGDRPGVVPAVRVEYHYRCDAPVRNGEPPLVSIVGVTPTDNKASVTFVENGVPLTTLR